MRQPAPANRNHGPHAFIVDDDDALREALTFLLQSRGVNVAPFASAEAFLAQFNHTQRGCILTDVRMDGMSGIEMIEKLMAMKCSLPMLVLTGHGDVAMAVDAIKSGVRDFVEKPFNTNVLADKIIAAIADDAAAAKKQSEQKLHEQQMAKLSERERKVMNLILAGKLNKVIANELNISTRTVEVHRSRIFVHMEVHNVVELANLLSRMRS